MLYRTFQIDYSVHYQLDDLIISYLDGANLKIEELLAEGTCADIKVSNNDIIIRYLTKIMKIFNVDNAIEKRSFEE